ncbi:PKD domain-containing protein [bacterium AH-315-M05]|nr:PKD domain-containing protein [bacterium AH-315-M05]
MADNASIDLTGHDAFITNGKVELVNFSALLLSSAEFHMINNALMTINNSSSLILFPNLELKLFADSRIVIDPSSGLGYSFGVSILLNDDNSLIEISGILDIGNNADFTFTGSGFVRVFSPNVQVGTNSKIILSGSDNNDKVLEIRGNFNPPDNLSLFRVLNAKIRFATSNAILNLGCPMQLFGVKLISDVQSVGLKVYGQDVAVIAGCTFDKTPIFGLLSYYGSKLTIGNSTISNSSGLGVNGAGFTLSNVTFTNAGLGAIGLQEPSNIIGCEFTNNSNFGISLSSGYGVAVNLRNTDVVGNVNGIGIEANNIYLNVKCGSINNNFMGFLIVYNTTLNMSTAMNAGYVDASGNAVTIWTDDAYMFYLDDGYNVLSIDQNSVFPYIVYGTLTGIVCPSNPPFVVDLAVNKNKWYPALGPPLSQDYFLQSTGCNIILIDNNSQNPVTCGLFDPPVPVIGLPKLPTCHPCPVINTADFNNVDLPDAIEIALSNMELIDNTKDDITAIDLFHQILTTPLDRSQPKIEGLTYFAYSHMKNSLANAFGTGKITEADNIITLHPSVQQLIDVQNALTDSTIDSSNVLRWFYLELDKAHVYRLIGKRDTCLQMLNAIDHCLLRHKDRVYLKRQIALVNAEHLVLTGQVPREKFDSLIQDIPLIELPKPTIIDSTATIDPTVDIGNGVSIGEGTVVDEDAIIGDNVTIGNNATIMEQSSIGTGSVIGDSTIVGEGAAIGENTSIGSNVLINENATIGDNVIIEDNAVVGQDVIIGSMVTLGANTTVNEGVQIADGSSIGSNSQIDENAKVGSNVIVAASTSVGESVEIGNGTVVSSNVNINESAMIGKDVQIAENISIGENATVCDNKVVTVDIPDNGVVCSPFSLTPPTAPSDVVYDCNFAVTRAQLHRNFLNGFTAEAIGGPCEGDLPLLFLGGDSGEVLLAQHLIQFAPATLSSNYFWDFGDCTTSTDESPVHTYPNAGTYVITLVQDINCVLDTLIGAITIYPNPSPDFTTTETPTCDTMRFVTFDKNPLPFGTEFSLPCFSQTPACTSFTSLDTSRLRVKYNWSFGTPLCPPLEEIFTVNELIAGEDTNITCSYPQDGTFIVSLTVTLQVKDLHDDQWKSISCINTFTDTIQTGVNTPCNFQAIYGGSGQDQAYNVIITQDGGYAITGFTTTFGAGNRDVYVVKLDDNGAVEWSKTF